MCVVHVFRVDEDGIATPPLTTLYAYLGVMCVGDNLQAR